MDLNQITKTIDNLLKKKAGIAVIGVAAIFGCGYYKLPIEIPALIAGIVIVFIICQTFLDRKKE